MAESNEGNGSTGPAPAASTSPQAEQQTPPLSITLQYVKDLSFENPRAPHSFGNLNPAPEIAVEINVEAHAVQKNVFELVLHIRARAARGEEVFFVVELAYAGICVVGNVPQQHIQPLVTIEGPRLLFPFARAILADCVRDGGFPPLLINPIDFARLYQQNVEQARTAQNKAET